MAIPVSQLGWMAGILDLKGRITNKNNRERATLQRVLYVESKQILVIRGLSRMTGNAPEPMDNRKPKDWMRRGCAEHCPDQHIHIGTNEIGMPATSRWTITGAALAVVVSNVLPFMQSEDQICVMEEAMRQSVIQATLTGQGSGTTLGAIRRLKELGWELIPSFDEALQVKALTAA